MLIRVTGQPAPQGSYRAVGRSGHTRLIPTNERALTAWRLAVSEAAEEVMNGEPLLTGPVYVAMRFVVPRPKGHYRQSAKRWWQQLPSAPVRPYKRPDLDKLCRAIGDALTGRVYRDDSQITTLVASKHYVIRPDDWTGVEILVTEDIEHDDVSNPVDVGESG
jgi:crossover junction endodeoxyribonuclease RusA